MKKWKVGDRLTLPATDDLPEQRATVIQVKRHVLMFVIDIEDRHPLDPDGLGEAVLDSNGELDL